MIMSQISAQIPAENPTRINTHPTTRSIGVDLADGLRQYPLWRYLAWQDLSKQYSRTAIGVLWIPLNILIHVTVLGIVFSAVLHSHKGYIGYFGLSYSIWMTISRSLTEASMLWVNSAKYIKQFSVPISVFLFKTIYKLAMIFSLSLPIGLVFAFVFGVRPSMEMLFAIPGILLYFLNLTWIVTLLSIVSLRYRDIAKFMPNMLFLIYLTTPILWSVDRLGEDHLWIAQMNPIYHLISLIRDPLMGQVPSMTSWLVVLSIGIVGNIIGLWAINSYRWKIQLWL